MRRKRKLRILNEHMLPQQGYAGEKPTYKETLHNHTLLRWTEASGGESSHEGSLPPGQGRRGPGRQRSARGLSQVGSNS